MKSWFTIFFLIGGLLCGPNVIWAAPYLVCDPYAADVGVTKFLVAFDGGDYVESAPVDNALKYDLSGLPNGKHTVVAKGCNAGGCSKDSEPFSFTLSIITVPVNIKVVNQ